jgi:hypothetical protein
MQVSTRRSPCPQIESNRLTASSSSSSASSENVDVNQRRMFCLSDRRASSFTSSSNEAAAQAQVMMRIWHIADRFRTVKS